MINAPKFAIILSGSGVFDGSEIHEATLTMLAIDERWCKYQCFAPNIPQAKTIDHYTGEATALEGDEDNRQVLAESARIARGEVKDLIDLDVKDFDAIIFPGGFGAAMNLSNFATKGADCDVHEEVERVITEAHKEGIIIGAMCIAPVIIARVLGKKGVIVTIGNDKSIAKGITKMGAKHEECESYDVCIDETNKVVTTPAYMLAKSIREVRAGTYNLIGEVIDMMNLDEDKKCKCGPDCTCGCQEGKECTCGGECHCADGDCDCGCQEGKECTCGCGCKD